MSDPTKHVSVTEDVTTVWYVRSTAVTGALLEACRSTLTAEEHAQSVRYVFEKNRVEYLLTRGLCRGVLARATGVKTAELVFERNAYGRPSLVRPSSALSFNLTNTVELVALGVARGREIGIDAEPVSRADQVLEIADTVFTVRELREMRALPEVAARRTRALQLWTLKEAYMKARGMGMSLPPQSFELGFENDAIQLRLVDNRDADDPSRWELTTREAEGHMIAVCIERRDGVGPIAVRAAELDELLG